MDKPDMLSSVKNEVSSLVSEGFKDFISETVTQEVEKKTKQFLDDLNMCEEVFPNRCTKFNPYVNESVMVIQTINGRTVSLPSSDEYIVSKLTILRGTQHLNLSSGCSDAVIWHLSNHGKMYRKDPGNGLKKMTPPSHDIDKLKKEGVVDLVSYQSIMNPSKLTTEYIEIIEMLSSTIKTVPYYQLQTIYAKYHPKASEHFVIENKLKHLSDVESRVSEAVKKEKDRLDKEVQSYEDKNLHLTNDIATLKADKEQVQRDKDALRLMNKHAKQKLDQLSLEKAKAHEIVVEKANKELDVRRQKLIEDTHALQQASNKNKAFLKELLTIAMSINEVNDKSDDKLSVGEDIFNIIGELIEISGCSVPKMVKGGGGDAVKEEEPEMTTD
jgi:hypothetical protein